MLIDHILVSELCQNQSHMECTDDGLFRPFQCNQGDCACVDPSTGVEIQSGSELSELDCLGLGLLEHFLMLFLCFFSVETQSNKATQATNNPPSNSVLILGIVATVGFVIGIAVVTVLRLRASKRVARHPEYHNDTYKIFLESRKFLSPTEPGMRVSPPRVPPLIAAPATARDDSYISQRPLLIESYF